MECPGEQVDVTHAADHLLRLEPGGIRFAPHIQLLEPGRTREPAACRRTQQFLKVREKVVLAAIQAQ